MRTFPVVLTMAALTVAVASCRRAPEPGVPALGPDVVAVVGERTVTRAALEKELARRGPGTTKEMVLEDLIRFEAALTQARGAGFDRDPEVVAATERLLVARYEERELAGAESPIVSDEEVQAAYSAQAARFGIPEARRGGVIFLKASSKSAPEQQAALRRRAERIQAEVAGADDAGFERLVREHSEDAATRYRGGDTGWLTAGDAGGWEPAVVAALFALRQPADAAPLVVTEKAFHIVRLTEIRPASRRPLEEVRDALRHELKQARRGQLTEAYWARIRSGLSIRTNTVVLEQILPGTQVSGPPPTFP